MSHVRFPITIVKFKSRKIGNVWSKALSFDLQAGIYCNECHWRLINGRYEWQESRILIDKWKFLFDVRSLFDCARFDPIRERESAGMRRSDAARVPGQWVTEGYAEEGRVGLGNAGTLWIYIFAIILRYSKLIFFIFYDYWG